MFDSVNPFSPLLNNIEKTIELVDNIDNEAIVAADYDFLNLLNTMSNSLKEKIQNMVDYNEKNNRYR